MKKYILFRMNQDLCAIHVADVLEITPIHTMILTNTDSLNVSVWNTKPLPVLDPVSMLGLEEHVPTIKSRILIIRKKGTDVGILVEEIVGIVEIDNNQIDEPSVSDHRYVSGIFNGHIRIFDGDKFITKKLQEKFELIRMLDMEELQSASKKQGIIPYGRDALLENARLKTLNWTIKATKQNIEDKFIKEALEIHNLISEL